MYMSLVIGLFGLENLKMQKHYKLANVPVSHGGPFASYGPTLSCVLCKIWT